MYEVAKKAGLSFPVVSRFCHGKRDIRLATAEKLADQLGLDLRRVRQKKPARRKLARRRST